MLSEDRLPLFGLHHWYSFLDIQQFVVRWNCPHSNKSLHKKHFSLSDDEDERYRCACLTGDETLCGWWSSMKYLAGRNQYLKMIWGLVSAGKADYVILFIYFVITAPSAITPISAQYQFFPNSCISCVLTRPFRFHHDWLVSNTWDYCFIHVWHQTNESSGPTFSRKKLIFQTADTRMKQCSCILRK